MCRPKTPSAFVLSGLEEKLLKLRNDHHVLLSIGQTIGGSVSRSNRRCLLSASVKAARHHQGRPPQTATNPASGLPEGKGMGNPAAIGETRGRAHEEDRLAMLILGQFNRVSTLGEVLDCAPTIRRSQLHPTEPRVQLPSVYRVCHPLHRLGVGDSAGLERFPTSASLGCSPAPSRIGSFSRSRSRVHIRIRCELFRIVVADTWLLRRTR